MNIDLLRFSLFLLLVIKKLASLITANAGLQVKCLCILNRAAKSAISYIDIKDETSSNKLLLLYFLITVFIITIILKSSAKV